MNQGQYSGLLAALNKLIEIQDENRRLLRRIDERLKPQEQAQPKTRRKPQPKQESSA